MDSKWGPESAQSIDDGVFTTLQLSVDDLARVSAAGFRSIINNRPDFEAGPSQPTSAELEAVARAEGLTYHYLPVQPSGHSDADARRMAELVQSSPKPVLAFCRTGRRSAALFGKGKALP
jgi:uncharacterized protein (TIGR01244 family)